MKHTLFNHFNIDGDLLTLRTQGREGKVVVPLSRILKLKTPFGHAYIETEEKNLKLDLRNFDPAEWKEVKELLQNAYRKNRRVNRVAGG